MKRIAIKIAESKDKNRAIYIDKQNAEEIFTYINQDERHIKKFRFITSIILAGLRNTELYDKESFDSKSKGVTAMKFFKGQENDRIYCKELTLNDKTFVIIAAELLEKKKTQKLNQKIKNLIYKVSSYEYELE